MPQVLPVWAGVVCALGLLSACASGRSADPFAGRRVQPPPIVYSALLTHPTRPGADFQFDRERMPEELLEFSGIGYGMTVLDLGAGDGYFAELFSHAVGVEGRVFMHNPARLEPDMDEAIFERLDRRLRNTSEVRARFDSLGLEDGTVDLVTWFSAPTTLVSLEEGMDGASEQVFLEIVRVMKTGGSLVMSGYASEESDPLRDTVVRGEIDQAFLVDIARAAGLAMVERRDALTHPEEASRRRAGGVGIQDDRFLLKFRK